MWRAHLADGRTVDHDGTNNILGFINEIVRFDVIGSRGTVTLTPPPGHRVMFAKDRIGGPGLDAETIAYKVGMLDRSTGAIEGLYVVDGEPMPDVAFQFSQEVVALYEAA